MFIFIVVGIFLLIVGVLIIVNRQLKKSRCTEVTNGKIVDMVSERTSERNQNGDYNTKTTFYALYEYTVGENKYIKRSSTGSSMPTFFVGQDVEIHYNPENPNEYYANKNIGQIIVGIGMTIVGVIVTVIGTIAVSLR